MTSQSKNKQSRAFLFDVSMEVANKVGGIYSVLKSKTPSAVNEWGEAFCFVGPDTPGKHAHELEDQPHQMLGPVLSNLEKDWGLKSRYGRWLIPGHPKAILLSLDYTCDHRLRKYVEDAQYYLNTKYSINIHPPGHPTDSDFVSYEFIWNAFLLGCVSSLFFQALAHHFDHVGESNLVTAHFHEWLGGVGLLLLRRMANEDKEFWYKKHWFPASVFTCHATILGRHLAASGENVSINVERFKDSADDHARHLGIFTQHNLEKQMAHSCHVLTAVSSITAEEATALLGRKVDVVTPNGTGYAQSPYSYSRPIPSALPNVVFSPEEHQGHAVMIGGRRLYETSDDPQNVPHKLQVTHSEHKNQLWHFVKSHFMGPSLQNMTKEKTFFFFTAGRNEFTNKGFDMYIDALASLNNKLKAENADVTVVAFIVTPAPNYHTSVSTLNGMNLESAIGSLTNRIASSVKKSIQHVIEQNGTMPEKLVDFLSENDLISIKSMQSEVSHSATDKPPICTHQLKDFDNDPIHQKCLAQGLDNHTSQRVKVVYHPRFLDHISSPIRLDYQDFVRACHLGCFVSAYEPWGLTQPECQTAGVASITANTCGSGRYIEEVCKEEQPDVDVNANFWLASSGGVYVADRKFIHPGETIERICTTMHQYLELNLRERIDLRYRAERTSRMFNWNHMYKYYDEAHLAALDCRDKEKF